MTFRFKGIRVLLLPVILLGIGGCAQNAPSNSGNLLKELAASFLVARSFDRIVVAVQSDNDDRSKSAGDDLSLAARNSGNYDFIRLSVQTLANTGGAYLDKLSRADGDERAELLKSSKQNYRAALALLPTDYQRITEINLDAVTLNQLGYFLADHGDTSDDFKLAEFLTAAAVGQLDLIIKSLPKDDPRLPAILLTRAVGAGDSKAWALYKQGRYAQARSEQEAVIETEKKYAESFGQIPTAEIRFHLAEIYLALDERKLAQESYEQALVLGPDDALRVKIEARLATIEKSISM